MSTAQELVERRSTGVMAAGVLAEGFVSIGAVILSIIGLANRFPQIMLPISTIAIGSALLFEGGTITARFSSLFSLARVPIDIRQFGLGMTTEFVSGIAGIVLGVMALIGVQPLVLIPAAAIVFGASLILGAGSTARMNAILTQMTEQREAIREVMREAVLAAAGMQILVGIGAIALGVVALTGINPMALSLVAMLSLGFANLLSETAIINRVTGAARRHKAATA
ncbi:MAG: hypothetical protein M0Z75_11245 [Nitrospiraceae bacterium]|nr:hypothetical protein [Nitrospiraceae bacterium]